jgi:anaerobic magnesium-protoporphyrin IX monomethyl ester cyclase
MALNLERILLIHPVGGDKQSAATDIVRKANVMPPLGLASLAAWLEQEGFQADILDLNADPAAEAGLEDYIRTTQPGFVGFSCTTSAFLDATGLARQIKDWAPETVTVVGGAHVSALREQVLSSFPEFDYGVWGEGEQTLCALMRGDPSDREGLIYREAGVVRCGGRRRGIDMDRLPFPAYDKLPGYPHSYTLPIFNYPKVPNASFITSRGCPYGCSYCDRSVFGAVFRYNSADYVYRHMKYLRDRFGVRHLNVYDDQFTLHRGRVMELAQRLIEEPLGMTFNCATRPDRVDAELLGALKRAGCWMISLGIETGDPDLLERHRSRGDLDRMQAAVKSIKRAGIRAKGLVMIGLPGETESSVRRSMRYVHRLPIDDLNVAKFTPFPGTPLYHDVRQQGSFDEDWNRMDCMHFLFVPAGFTVARLEMLFLRFYKGHAMRPRTLWGYFSMLWKSPDSWRRFMANAGAFIRFGINNRRWQKE